MRPVIVASAILGALCTSTSTLVHAQGSDTNGFEALTAYVRPERAAGGRAEMSALASPFGRMVLGSINVQFAAPVEAGIDAAYYFRCSDCNAAEDRGAHAHAWAGYSADYWALGGYAVLSDGPVLNSDEDDTGLGVGLYFRLGAPEGLRLRLGSGYQRTLGSRSAMTFVGTAVVPLLRHRTVDVDWRARVWLSALAPMNVLAESGPRATFWNHVSIGVGWIRSETHSGIALHVGGAW